MVRMGDNRSLLHRIYCGSTAVRQHRRDGAKRSQSSPLRHFLDPKYIVLKFMVLLTPYTTKKIREASITEISEELDKQLKEGESNYLPHGYLKSQLLLQELSHRSVLRYTRWVTVLTFLYTVMTAIILYMTYIMLTKTH